MAAVSSYENSIYSGKSDLKVNGVFSNMGMFRDIVKYGFDRLPVKWQEAYRHPGLMRQIKELHELENKSYAERKMYQLHKVRALIQYAYEHTRYYRKVFDKCGIKPQDIRTLDDIDRIPILTKSDVRENLQDMISDIIPENERIYVTTGGSTGKPLGFYISKQVDTRRLAFEWLHWNHMGYSLGDPCVFLRGRVLAPGKWFSYEKSNNFLVLSTFMMREDILSEYVNKIDEFAPVFIQAYPSAISILAEWMLANGKTLKKQIKAISTSSEILYPEQKTMIERAFQAPVFDKYGNCEQVGVIGMQADGLYHEFMEHSYLEYLDENNTKALPGSNARIIGTSLINNVVPFIRYETGDMVRLHKEICSGGNARPSTLIDSIQGRWFGDVMVAKNGNLISVTAMNTHSNIFDHTCRIQYYQDTKGVVVLKVVKTPEYTNEDEIRILDELQSKFQGQVDLHIEYVDDIPRTARGKYLYLDQRLKGI